MDVFSFIAKRRLAVSRYQGNVIFSVLSLITLLFFLLAGIKNVFSAENPSACGKSVDLRCQPNIVKIVTNYDEANVFIRDCGESCKDIYIAYSKDITSIPSEIRLAPVHDPNMGLLSAKVSGLDTNSTYYFKIKCADEKNCAQYTSYQEVQTSQCSIDHDLIADTKKTLICGNAKIAGQTNDEKMTDVHISNTYDSIKKYAAPVFGVTFGITVFLFITKKDSYHKFKKRPRTIYRSRIVNT